MVGDQFDACFTLACKDGVSGPCEHWNEPHRYGVKVTCYKVKNDYEMMESDDPSHDHNNDSEHNHNDDH